MLTESFTMKKRLIVLLPDSVGRNDALARKIQWNAIREQCDVLYLILVDHDEYSRSRTLDVGEMASLTTSATTKAIFHSISRSAWLQALRETIQPQDVVVCLTEQTVRKGWLGLLPLGQYIESEFPNHVIQLPGFYRPEREQLSRLGRQLLFLLGCGVILALFTALEISLDRSLSGSVRIIIQCLVVCCEFGTVYGWNSLMRA